MIADLIDKEEWSPLDTDVKGDAYEGLLQKNPEDVKGVAGQYFTPRPLNAADARGGGLRSGVSDGRFPTRGARFHPQAPQARQGAASFSQHELLRGVELGDSVARLCCMNLVLHGIGSDAAHVPVLVKDALAGVLLSRHFQEK